jgi:hypothetical protein
VGCAVLTLASTALLTAVGPFVLRLLFGFHHGADWLTFLAMGVSVGMFLGAAVLAQALLGRGLHAATTVGWLLGLVALAAGTAVPGSAVTRATVGFLAGAVVAFAACSVLVLRALRDWPAIAEPERGLPRGTRAAPPG